MFGRIDKLDFAVAFYLPLDPVEDILAVGSRLVENQLLSNPPLADRSVLASRLAS
jgi:hypothetical protein